MLISELANNLKNGCVVSFKLENDFGAISKKFGLRSVAKIRRVDSKGLMVINSVLRESLPLDFSREMEKIGAVNYHGSWSVAIDISSHNIMPFFTELITIPSVVVDAILIKDDRCYLYFRYHANNHNDVIGVLGKHSQTVTKLAVVSLGAMESRFELLKRLSQEVPLHYFEISTKVPPKSMDIMNDPVITTFGNNWMREIKYLHEGNTHSVYYEKGELLSKSGTVEISKDEKIYETTFQNPLIDFYFKECTDSYIALLGMAQKLVGRDFVFSVIIPSMHVENFTSIIFNSFSKFSSWQMSLREVHSCLEL